MDWDTWDEVVGSAKKRCDELKAYVSKLTFELNEAEKIYAALGEAHPANKVHAPAGVGSINTRKKVASR